MKSPFIYITYLTAELPRLLNRKYNLMKEENVWRKPWRGIMLKIALVYPNYYSAMAGLTVQTLYSLWNTSPRVICERFFLPESPNPLPQGNRMAPVRSLENEMVLADFDIIAFTLSYELDYPHICWFLDNAHIPWKRNDRAITTIITNPNKSQLKSTLPSQNILHNQNSPQIQNSLEAPEVTPRVV